MDTKRRTKPTKADEDKARLISISIYPRELKILTDYAAANGYSPSLAARRIISQWAETRQGCTCPNAEMLSQFEDA